MKNHIPFIAAAALFCGCSIEEIPSDGGTVLAAMEDDHTRSAVTDEGVFTWSKGDQIWIQTTAGNAIGTLSSGDGNSKAQFSYGSFIGEMTGKAIYPYNAGHSISENTLNVTLPSSYNLGASLSNTNAIMFGEEVDGTLKFSHLAGVMRFSFKNVPAGTDRFTITLDKKINGSFTTALTSGIPVIVTEDCEVEYEKNVSLCFEALETTSDIKLHVPLPIGTYSSLSLALFKGEEQVWSYSNTVTNTIGRKTLKIMPTVTLDSEVEGDDTPQASYWAGKKFIINGDSVVYGSGLSSVYDGFSYLIAEHFGMEITNYAIGGSVIARRAKDYDECFTSKAEWEEAMNAGLLNTKKKYLVNTESGAPRIYRIYSYKNSKWTAGGNTSDATGRVPLSDRIRAMDTDADVIMIMAGSNDFYYNWTAFGDFEAGKNRENLENIDPDANLLESDGVELVHKGAPPASSPNIDYSYPAYFTYCKIPVAGGCEVKVPYGRRGWWLDKDGKGISNKNFTSEVTDFTATAPYNAAYLTVCFKYEEVNPEDCVVYMSVPTDKNAPNETFCDGLHKLCRYLCDTYKDKDIIFLTPIKRKQPKGTSGGTWDCLDSDATNAEGKTLIDYRDAIIEACEYYSIPYIDMYTLSGLDPHTDPSLFADTDGRAVHPNEEGHRIFADVLIEQMEKLKQ